MGTFWNFFTLLVFFSFFFFWPHYAACGILVPRPGIEPVPPALGAQSLNHWTTREVPLYWLFITKHYLVFVTKFKDVYKVKPHVPLSSLPLFLLQPTFPSDRCQMLTAGVTWTSHYLCLVKLIHRTQILFHKNNIIGDISPATCFSHRGHISSQKYRSIQYFLIFKGCIYSIVRYNLNQTV